MAAQPCMPQGFYHCLNMLQFGHRKAPSWLTMAFPDVQFAAKTGKLATEMRRRANCLRKTAV
jgi:hypothetical protein